MSERRKSMMVLTIVVLCATQAFAQINVRGYRLVYSSETAERAASLLDLDEEALANCTGDFVDRESLERHWRYSPKATSTWNKRMGTTDEERARVHRPQEGHLHMLAVSTDGTADGFVTSGVEMKQGYRYGIFEVKAKCLPHQSNFPAVWMMPVDQSDGWPNCGEIDIMEQIGTSSTVWSTVHLGARYDKPVGKTYTYSGNLSASSDWHVYSLRWDKLSLTFYCDGRQVFRYAKDATLDLAAHPDYEKWQFPYNKAYYIILDQALGMNTWWDSEAPDPSFTYEMDVEYVRIWQNSDSDEPDIVSSPTPSASDGHRKVWRDGRLVIRKGYEEYTLAGTRLK
ncbi:MAG: glycoside hydrolase family 16 protein [Bacteroidaceae bacterium]|nr:glycoside hydrolase family 16 protein [Bacteroidaceae bacterium]